MLRPATLAIALAVPVMAFFNLLVLAGPVGLARVSARAHHTSDVRAASLLAAIILGGWSLLRSRAPQVIGASLAVALAVAMVPAQTMAASPSPATGGDPRSSGQGPGFVGDPGTAILLVAGIGLASAVVTYLYVKATPGRRRDDRSVRKSDT